MSPTGSTPANPGQRQPRAGRGVAWLAGAIILGMLAFKAWSIPRLSFHWDEFWFLSKVHAGMRGELASGFQAFHVPVMSWLVGLGDEIVQLQAARWVMWGLLCVSCGLMYALARRWSRPAGALMAVAAFVSLWPVVAHGGSFRADSFLLPLTLATLWLLSHPRQGPGRLVGAGGLWGLAAAFSIKAVLLAPACLAMMLSPGWPGWRELSRRVALVGAGALAAMGAAIGLESVALDFAAPAVEAATHQASGAAAKVFFSKWFFQPEGLFLVAQRNPVVVALAAIGAILAVAERRAAVAGLCLALAPIAFYRNTFLYYYVLMMAPACVLVSLPIDRLVGLVDRRQGRARMGALAGLAVAVLGVGLGAASNAERLTWTLHQADQARVVAAVHRLFPTPVPYLDPSGIIASFPKANGFLSTWGVENYHEAGQAFMPGMLSSIRPPLLIAGRSVLIPKAGLEDRLLPDDRRLITASYQHYWGPIWLAGVAIAPGQDRIHPPFPGRYRVESTGPVILDGRLLQEGETFIATEDMVEKGIEVSGLAATHGRLIWATQGEAPDAQPPTRMFILPH